MAIFGVEEEIKYNVTHKEDRSIVPMFQSDRVNDKLKAYIVGPKWNVTYFHRNVTNEDFVTQYDPNLDPTLQNYNRLDDFVINVDSPIESGTNDLQGNGYIDGGFIPNPNDIFIAKLLDGKSIIFTIKNVTKTDYNNDTIFHVDYELYAELAGADDPLLVTLLKSTTDEFIYNKDYRKTRTQPIYTKEQYHDRNDLYASINSLLDHYTHTFITPSTNYYLAYMHNNKVTYDAQLFSFIRDTIGINNLPDNLSVVEINDHNISILDLLIAHNPSTSRLHKYLTHVPVRELNNDPYMFSLSYNNVDVYVDVSHKPMLDQVDRLINSYYPKLEQSTYIFRPSVYEEILNPDLNLNSTTYSLFEQLVIATLSGSPITKNNITTLIDNVYQLPEPEQFYYIPILIYIAKYYIATYTVEFL